MKYSRDKINIALFASGTGSNAKAITQYFQDHDSIRVGLIASNKVDAGVFHLCEEFHIPKLHLSRSLFYDHETQMLKALDHEKIDYIILAGFLWLMPSYLIANYSDKILNIHPSLLPKYGGKGMYGHHVHQAVFDNKESVSGMTIHLVNEKYDEGKILFQASIPVNDCHSPEEIAKKVLSLEHLHYAPTIENYILGINSTLPKTV